jgi:transposase
MSTTQAVPQREDTAIAGDLYMSFELGDKSWKVTASDGRHTPSRYNVDAGDTAAVALCIGKARERCRPGCTRATRQAATAGGCTAG